MKYLSSTPFSSPPASPDYRKNYPFPPKDPPVTVTWQACVHCGRPVRPSEAVCPSCGFARESLNRTFLDAAFSRVHGSSAFVATTEKLSKDPSTKE